jgi:hypothetical protein
MTMAGAGGRSGWAAVGGPGRGLLAHVPAVVRCCGVDRRHRDEHVGVVVEERGGRRIGMRAKTWAYLSGDQGRRREGLASMTGAVSEG